MTEIEKTIKSLKEMFPKGLCEVDEYKMAQVAINALEKQIPKKTMQGEPYWWIDTVKVKGRNKEVRKKSYGHKCPCCGKCVTKLSNIFCNHCGQKLDWSDSD